MTECERCGGTHVRRPRDNTLLGHKLALLEDADPEVAAAADRLDEAMRNGLGIGDVAHRQFVADLYADTR